MSDYIKREDAIKSFVNAANQAGNIGDQIAFRMIISEIPTADVRDNVKGEWGRTKNGFIYCSNCEATWYDNAWTDYWHYCPNCGADMRGEA